MRNNICTSVAALLDSCLSKFGKCFMKPVNMVRIGVCKQHEIYLPTFHNPVLKSLSSLNIRAN